MIVTLIVILYLGYQTYKGYQLGFAQRVINMILVQLYLQQLF